MRYWYKFVYSSALLLLAATSAFSQAGGGSLPNYTVTFTLNEGKSVILHAGSTNAAGYQWYKNGVPVAGQTGKDYSTRIEGIYTVVAFNKDGCKSNESDGVRIVVIAPITLIPKPDTVVDLAISIHSTNKNARLGESFEYGITVTNKSLLTGHQLVMKYPLPSILKGLPPVKPIALGNYTYDPGSNVFTWYVPELAGGASISLNALVKILKSGPITSTVHISGKEKDPFMANNEDTDTQQIAGLLIPNVLKPNGDGLNDTFIKTGLNQLNHNNTNIINHLANTR